VARIRDAFEERVVAALPGAIIIARSAARIWNTSLIAFPGLEAAAIVLALSRRGVCASAGSACSSGSLEPSPALLAMGVPHDVAHGAVRFSFGRDANESMAFDAADRVIAVVRRVAAIGGCATPG
jgi:cysteine desulfurase